MKVTQYNWHWYFIDYDCGTVLEFYHGELYLFKDEWHHQINIFDESINFFIL